MDPFTNRPSVRVNRMAPIEVNSAENIARRLDRPSLGETSSSSSMGEGLSLTSSGVTETSIGLTTSNFNIGDGFTRSGAGVGEGLTSSNLNIGDGLTSNLGTLSVYEDGLEISNLLTIQGITSHPLANLGGSGPISVIDIPPQQNKIDLIVKVVVTTAAVISIAQKLYNVSFNGNGGGGIGGIGGSGGSGGSGSGGGGGNGNGGELVDLLRFPEEIKDHTLKPTDVPLLRSKKIAAVVALSIVGSVLYQKSPRFRKIVDTTVEKSLDLAKEISKALMELAKELISKIPFIGFIARAFYFLFAAFQYYLLYKSLIVLQPYLNHFKTQDQNWSELLTLLIKKILVCVQLVINYLVSVLS